MHRPPGPLLGGVLFVACQAAPPGEEPQTASAEEEPAEQRAAADEAAAAAPEAERAGRFAERLDAPLVRLEPSEVADLPLDDAPPWDDLLGAWRGPFGPTDGTVVVVPTRPTEVLLLVPDDGGWERIRVGPIRLPRDRRAQPVQTYDAGLVDLDGDGVGELVIVGVWERYLWDRFERFQYNVVLEWDGEQVRHIDHRQAQIAPDLPRLRTILSLDPSLARHALDP